jgi:hypothetical protein
MYGELLSSIASCQLFFQGLNAVKIHVDCSNYNLLTLFRLLKCLSLDLLIQLQSNPS